jgi:anthranilate synthase component 2
MVLLIDNYDSFTYNLYQYMGDINPDILVKRNDKITLDEIRALNPSHIVLSPGPKTPYEAGICMDVIKEFHTTIPILGICLGHQCIGAAFGGTVRYAKELFHGKSSNVKHDNKGIFKDLPNPLTVARYHSLAVESSDLPDELIALASTEDGEIMAMRHKKHPLIGLQFHPESIITNKGIQLIENFMKGAF